MNVIARIHAPVDLEPLSRRTVSKAAIRGRLAFSLFIADVLAICLAFGIGRLIRFGSSADAAIGLASSFLPIYLTTALAMHTYSVGNLIKPARSAVSGAATLAVSTGVWAVVLFCLKAAQDFSRLEFAIGLAISLVTICLSRVVCALHARRELGGEVYTTVELYDSESTQTVAPARALDIGGLFDPRTATATEFDLLSRIIGAADRVIVHCSPERRRAWAHVLKGMNVHGEVSCDELRELQPLGLSAYNGRTALVVARGPLDIRRRAIKRGFDIAFSAFVLVALLPVLGVIALAIRLESPGPVLFRQPRIGRQNRLFQVYKFRSMYQSGSDLAGARSTTRKDNRVTRVGRFIRATSIDELPQFLNVIRGDMSIVGPRPHAISSRAEEQLFWEIDDRYWHRHACRPGITGRAQVMGLRGATDRIFDLTRRVDADLDYLQTWSFWNDLKIIAATIRVMVHPRAY